MKTITMLENSSCRRNSAVTSYWLFREISDQHALDLPFVSEWSDFSRTSTYFSLFGTQIMPLRQSWGFLVLSSQIFLKPRLPWAIKCCWYSDRVHAFWSLLRVTFLLPLILFSCLSIYPTYRDTFSSISVTKLYYSHIALQSLRSTCPEVPNKLAKYDDFLPIFGDPSLSALSGQNKAPSYLHANRNRSGLA